MPPTSTEPLHRDASPAATGSGAGLLSAGLAAAAIAAVLNVALATATVAALDVADGYDPLAVRAVLVTTVGAVAASVVLLAVLTRWTSRPRRVFTVLVVLGALLSLGGPVSLLQEPQQYAQATGAVVAMTGLLHVVTAAVVLLVLPRGVRA